MPLLTGTWAVKRTLVGRSPIAATAVRWDPERATIGLVVVIIVSCMILGRFVIPYGGSNTPLAGVVGYGVVTVGFTRGLLALDRRRVLLYLILVTMVLLGAACNALVSNPFAISTSWMSMLQFMLLTGFATLSFRYPVDETRFFRAVSLCFAFVAVMGLLQFFGQFAGVVIFHFSDVIPPRFLTEQITGGGYNNEIPIGLGSLFKSNGFFLAEPSIFSQFMAVAIAIETLFFCRPIFFILFVAALLSSVSGTGWVVLICFVATVGISMGQRGLVIAVGLSLGFGLALLVWSMAMPDVFEAFISRSNEVSSTGSSGQIRFITPFWIAKEVVDRSTWALLIGVGSGVSEHFWRPYEGDINTPVKIALENGLPVLFCYLSLIGLGHHTLRQRRLLPAILVLLGLTGGYSQFPPVLFPFLLIVPVGTLKTTSGRSRGFGY